MIQNRTNLYESIKQDKAEDRERGICRGKRVSKHHKSTNKYTKHTCNFLIDNRLYMCVSTKHG